MNAVAQKPSPADSVKAVEPAEPKTMGQQLNSAELNQWRELCKEALEGKSAFAASAKLQGVSKNLAGILAKDRQVEIAPIHYLQEGSGEALFLVGKNQLFRAKMSDGSVSVEKMVPPHKSMDANEIMKSLSHLYQGKEMGSEEQGAVLSYLSHILTTKEGPNKQLIGKLGEAGKVIMADGFMEKAQVSAISPMQVSNGEIAFDVLASTEQGVFHLSFDGVAASATRMPIAADRNVTGVMDVYSKIFRGETLSEVDKKVILENYVSYMRERQAEPGVSEPEGFADVRQILSSPDEVSGDISVKNGELECDVTMKGTVGGAAREFNFRVADDRLTITDVAEQKEIASMKAELEEKKGKVIELDAKVIKVEKDLGAQTQRADSLQAELEQQKAKMEGLAMDLEQEAGRADSLQTAADSLGVELGKTKTSLEALQNEHEGLKKSYEAEVEKAKGLLEQVNSLTGKAERADSLQGVTDKLNAELDEWERDLTKADSTQEAQAVQLDTLRNDNKALKEKLEKMQGYVEELEAELDALEKKQSPAPADSATG